MQALSELPGLAGIGSRLWDVFVPWFVVVATGVGTGILAACLDVLSAWLSDLRSGLCRDTWWMSKSTCCAGLDCEYSPTFSDGGKADLLNVQWARRVTDGGPGARSSAATSCGSR